MIKQTQTKLFDFSDVGLDFCMGSKNKFPEVFKKMLSAGYNLKIANSVSISGSQVILTYGVNHGYVADRVLQVTATGGFNKEVYIDSVTASTVICTVLDGITAGLTGAINTKIAPLGWSLVYEVGNIHVYKMRHLDDTDRYVRFCFQNNPNHRNAIAVCIGKTANLTTGVIDDPLALQSTASITSPSAAWLPKWDTYSTTSSQANFSYSEGYPSFGKGMCVGSPYHFAFLTNDGYTSAPHHVYGIFPTVCYEYEKLDYPVLIGITPTSGGDGAGSSAGNFSRTTDTNGFASIGNIRVRFDSASSTASELMNSITPAAANSFLSANFEEFNTTTVKPLEIYEHSTAQHLGYCYGIFLCQYGVTDTPWIGITNNPLITTDTDFNNLIIVAASAAYNESAHTARFLAVPVETIKHA
ncbi:hypothetical protein QTA56_03405 [Acinetobacter sp. VNH17]|uniref:Phage tail protein n=1 Tax=Acinetobacter thutiue TaxID=2998078 RepID=A0ABT7WKS0_9GAMM|nr:hypothetical protein [Acinetobacter thutiue]MCY6411185.1 hypothetical protein [Acinetobacter thutiue]MDN0013287.1 hypothetical protein [Acinetobacter thutiue]